MALSIDQIEAHGRRIREALLTLGEVNQPPTPQFLFLYSCINNFLHDLEQDQGVGPSAFGSQGMQMHVVNPADGTALPTTPDSLGTLSQIAALQLPPSGS